jgi:hypothetical protein
MQPYQQRPRRRSSPQRKAVRPHPIAASQSQPFDPRMPSPVAVSPPPPLAPQWSEGVLLRAHQLGLHEAFDGDLMWIAKEAAEMPLPSGWARCDPPGGTPTYVNEWTGECAVDHPLDGYFRNLVESHRAHRATSPKGARPGPPVLGASPTPAVRVAATPSPPPFPPFGPPAVHRLVAGSPIPGPAIPVNHDGTPAFDANPAGLWTPAPRPAKAPVVITLSRSPPSGSPARNPRLPSPLRCPSDSSDSPDPGTPQSEPQKSPPASEPPAIAELRQQVAELKALVQSQQLQLQGFPALSPRPPELMIQPSSPATHGSAPGSARGVVSAGPTPLDPAAFLLKHGVDPTGISPAHLAALALYTSSIVEQCVADFARHYEASNFWRTLPAPHEAVQRRTEILEDKLRRLEAVYAAAPAAPIGGRTGSPTLLPVLSPAPPSFASLALPTMVVAPRAPAASPAEGRTRSPEAVPKSRKEVRRRSTDSLAMSSAASSAASSPSASSAAKRAPASGPRGPHPPRSVADILRNLST